MRNISRRDSSSMTNSPSTPTDNSFFFSDFEYQLPNNIVVNNSEGIDAEFMAKHIANYLVQQHSDENALSNEQFITNSAWAAAMLMSHDPQKQRGYYVDICQHLHHLQHTLCPDCLRTFARKDSLRRHQRNVCQNRKNTNRHVFYSTIM